MHIDDTAHTMAMEAQAIVRAAEHVGIALIYDGQLIASLAATDECSRTLTTLQRQHQQGPSLDLADNRQVVLVNDLLRDARWPETSASAIARTPVRSVLALTLCLDDHFRWTLELSADMPNAFTDHDVQRSQSWVNAQQQHLNNTGCSWGAGEDTAATALLAHRFALDSPAALALLIQISDHRHQPIAQVAAALLSPPR